MDDKEVQVQFKAVVGDLQSGLKQAADDVKETTTGMTGDVGGLGETISNLGSTAAVLAGVGLAFEGLKKAAEWIQEAVKDTNELADSFEKLAYATSASLEQLNIYTTALALSGDQAGDLEGLMVGMQRAIKANADLLIENGVAANRAALDAMPFEDYLRRVQELADQMATPTERQQFLMLALGRAGAMAGNQLKELVENMDEARRIVEQNGGIITQQSIDQLNEADRSTARLQTAQKTYASMVAANAQPIMNSFRDMRTAVVEVQIAQESMMDLATKGYIEMRYQADGYTLDLKAMAEAARQFKAVIAEGMRTAGNSMDAGARNVPQPEKRKLKTSEDVSAAKKAAEEKARAAQEVLRAQVQYELNLARDLEEEKRNIEREAQKEREKGLREWNAKLEKQAQEEKRLEDKKVLAAKQAADKIAAYEAQKLREQEAAYRRFFGSITSGFTSSMGRMFTEGQSFSQALKGAFSSVGMAIVQSLEDMAAEWLTNLLVTKAMAKTTAASQIAGNAGVAAVAAMGSVAAIPYVGWAMAPEVGAETFALAMGYMGTLASAADGFDIPAGVNPLTQLHEREMVLPAEHADTIRSLEGKGGGGQKIYISAVDAKGIERVLRRNQGSLIKLGNEATRNNRRRA